MEIWSGVTDALLTHSQTLKDSATQLLIKYKSGALVTQFLNMVGKVQIWPSKAYFFGENPLF